jgi:hypothetical protein
VYTVCEAKILPISKTNVKIPLLLTPIALGFTTDPYHAYMKIGIDLSQNTRKDD